MDELIDPTGRYRRMFFGEPEGMFPPNDDAIPPEGDAEWEQFEDWNEDHPFGEI